MQTNDATILVVDDNQGNLKILCSLLQKHGYSVRVANNGEIALKSVAATPPDLILLDIMMPGIDGYEVCSRLQADPSMQDIPILFLSALDDTTDKIKGFKVGGRDYITKPFQTDEILARIETHLELHFLKRKLAQNNEQLEKAVRQRTRELVQTNHILEANEQYIRSIYEAADNIALVATDLGGPQTKIQEFSPGAEKIFGFTRSQALGQWLAILIDPDQFDHITEIQSSISKNKEGFGGEATLIRQSGESFPAMLSIHPRKDINGYPVGMVMVAIDLSSQHEAAQRVICDREDTKERLGKRLEEDLHTPLQALHDLLPKTFESLSSEEQETLLQELHERVENMLVETKVLCQDFGTPYFQVS